MQTSPAPLAVSALALLGAVHLDSLTISRDVMPHHHIANAKIDDLEPAQMVAAIVVVEQAIRAQYPQMHRTGWTAKSDGLRIHFYAWALKGGTN